MGRRRSKLFDFRGKEGAASHIKASCYPCTNKRYAVLLVMEERKLRWRPWWEGPWGDLVDPRAGPLVDEPQLHCFQTPYPVCALLVHLVWWTLSKILHIFTKWAYCYTLLCWCTCRVKGAARNTRCLCICCSRVLQTPPERVAICAGINTRLPLHS